MDIVNKKNSIIDAVYRICKNKGVEVWHDLSNTTESVYFWIKYGEVKCKFRISDHPCSAKKQTKSITVAKSTGFSNIERFIENRIKHLKRAYLGFAFNHIHNTLSSENSAMAIA